MEISKNDIGKYYYFGEVVGNNFVCHYGKLVSILPKYNYLDSYSTTYHREMNFLFEEDGLTKMLTRAVSDENYIFNNIREVTEFIPTDEITILFSYSAYAKEHKI